MHELLMEADSVLIWRLSQLQVTPSLTGAASAHLVPAKWRERRAMSVTVSACPRTARLLRCQKPWMRGVTHLSLPRALRRCLRDETCLHGSVKPNVQVHHPSQGVGTPCRTSHALQISVKFDMPLGPPAKYDLLEGKSCTVQEPTSLYSTEHSLPRWSSKTQCLFGPQTSISCQGKASTVSQECA